jgi:DNA-binding IclR family transcriptional regulator/nitroimidazol reductase NimA-like FMN-containing flavoprotein (pyridoxamine 5'-phosphate oxidase superfamily)
LARTLRNMGHPSRLRILLALQYGPLPVHQIAQRSGLSQPNTSAHLAALRASGLVRGEPRGRQVLYSLADPGVAHLLHTALAESTPLPGPQVDLIEAFRRIARRASLGETLALAIYDPPHIVVLDQHISARRLHTAFRLGELMPPAACAAGALLGSQPSQAIQADGFHLLRTQEALELALPICADGHRPIAALLLSAPASRLSTTQARRLLPTLRQMAARISYALGARFYAPFQRPGSRAIAPIRSLDGEEIQAMLQAPWAANLACVRPDGTPHVVPVWHTWDGQCFTVAAWEGSRWADYLDRNPRVSLTIDEPWPPLRRVIARGRARALSTQASGERPPILDQLAERYLGRPAPREMVALPWRAFRIRVTSLRGWRGMPTKGP